MTLISKDNDENMIFCDGKSIYIKLSSENRDRKIGDFILVNGKTSFVKNYDKYKHLFITEDKKYVGIAHELLIHIKDKESYFCIKEFNEKKIKGIKLKDALEKGHFLWFKKSGFERQFFIDINEFKEINNYSL